MVPAPLIPMCALLALALAACGTGSPRPGSSNAVPGTSNAVPGTSSAAASGTSSAAPCTASGPEVDLGALAYDRIPDRHVRTSAGWYRITATGFLHGGLLDPKVGRTTVAWGLATTPPVYHAGPNTVSGALGTTDVVEGKDAWVRLPDATLWFLNVYGARLTLQGCPPAVPTLVPAT